MVAIDPDLETDLTTLKGINSVQSESTWQKIKMQSQLLLCTIIALTLASSTSATVNCTQTGNGRYPEPGDTTCKNYTLCVYDSSTSAYLAYDYICPTTSVFNPNTHLCTSSDDYTCNTTTSVCTSDGYVANPNSTDCSSYIECVEINGTYVETVYSCPDGTYYDPDTTYCEYDYVCTFNCTSTGRYANTTDDTCKSYYLCVLGSDGNYIQYFYVCPSTSLFDPGTKECTSNYTCG
ncbi:hypothetical protein EVAR_33970_1 [Eumeta japonica]|uniref:Chitin-binding type-2 domain-containing protein n=1 Tax=Eumeta variegata TaxID=151549 RepID=A0A4C1X3I4_EUMVA|nr:hypothetical protein EVAR_33970_1 [Eumeta japonica]